MTYWIIHIILIGTAAIFCKKFIRVDFPGWIYWSALMLKLLAGIILGYIFYEYYGTGDTISFFEIAQGNEKLSNDPRSQFFISILIPIVKLSGKSYWITSLWLSFISFIATWNAVRILSSIFQKSKYPIAICILFIPTVIFWSSGILKDTFAFAALITAIVLIIKFYKHTRLSTLDLLLLIVSMFLLFEIKHYLLITTLIFGGVLVASVMLKQINGKWKWIATLLFLGLTFFSTQVIHPYLTIDRIACTIYQNNVDIQQKSNDPISISIEDPSILSVIRATPSALHTGLFRPSIFDSVPLWGTIHQVENLLLTILLFISLILLIKKKPKIDRPLLFASISCVLLLAIMLPLSTPNFGTLVRYKNAYMPFLFLICSILPYQYSLLNRMINR